MPGTCKAKLRNNVKDLDPIKLLGRVPEPVSSCEHFRAVCKCRVCYRLRSSQFSIGTHIIDNRNVGNDNKVEPVDVTFGFVRARAHIGRYV